MTATTTRAGPPEHALYPPTVTPSDGFLPLWRFVPRFVDNPLAALPKRVYEEEMVVREMGPRGAVAWVTDPVLIEAILLTRTDVFIKSALERRAFDLMLGDGILVAQGQSWRWQRRTAAPLFRHADLVGLVPTMAAGAQEQLTRWRQSPPRTVHPVHLDMTNLTFVVLVRSLFSGDGIAEAAAIQRAGATFLDNIVWELAFGIVRLPPWLWHPGKRHMRRAAGELRTVMAGMIARRRAAMAAGQAPSTHDDLMGRLIAARDPETGEPMGDALLIDNLLTFLAAGHETTAKALMWTLYLLARAPQWQEQLAAEVEAVAGNGAIEGHHIDKLTLTRQVLKEAMRLYPPAPVMSRVASADVTLESGSGRSYHVRAGTLIVMPLYAMHRHRRLWDDPDRFDPMRFTPEREKAMHRAQFMPFGFGPRICIGMSFAMLEATTILATLVRGARFVWDGTYVPEPVSRVTLRARGGMPLAVEMR